MAELPEDVDPRLWITVDGIEGRCYLFANAHTFTGRMEAWSQSTKTDLAVSKSEIVDQSTESKYWIQGFLSGNEPPGENMFGPAFLDKNGGLEQRWRDACRGLRETGAWPFGYWQVPIGLPKGFRLTHTPWFLRVDEIWTWDDEGSAWGLANPQPEREFKLLQGTLCFERRFHEMELVTDCHLGCVDCGMTEETIPDGHSAEEWELARSSFRPTPT
jgi:hypothetical protein